MPGAATGVARPSTNWRRECRRPRSMLLAVIRNSAASPPAGAAAGDARTTPSARSRRRLPGMARGRRGVAPGPVRQRRHHRTVRRAAGYRQDAGRRSDRGPDRTRPDGGRAAAGLEVDRGNRQEPGRRVHRGRRLQLRAVLRRSRHPVRQARRGDPRSGPVRQPRSGYLLQRLDRYEGLVVLATNLRDQLDDAFTRRFHHLVHFPKPGPCDAVGCGD